MRIAICATLFGDDRRIGASRPRALATELVKAGHQVTVFTPQIRSDSVAAVPNGVDVVELPRYAPKEGQAASTLPIWQRTILLFTILHTNLKLEILSNPKLGETCGIRGDRAQSELATLKARRHLTTNFVRSFIDAVSWLRQSAPILDRFAKTNPPFDAVFATYGPISSLMLGNYLKGVSPDAALIYDFRDQMVHPRMLVSVRNLMRMLEKRCVKEADLVTVVSWGVASSVMSHRANVRHKNKLRVLRNGFVPRKVVDGTRPEGALRIVYTGQIYGGRQDATPVFEAIRNVLMRNPELSFEVHYAGKESSLMRQFAENVGLENILVDHGLLSHREAVELQDSADVLLLLSWNYGDHQGIVSGKFGEYLAASKPILASVTGDLPNCELAQLMKSMGVGHVFEEATNKDVEGIATFLEDAAQQVLHGKRPHFSPNQKKVDAFKYANIARNLVDLIRRVRCGQLPTQVALSP